MGEKVEIQGKAEDYGPELILIDPKTNSLMIVDYQHHEIHEGDSYFINYTGTVGDGSDIEIRIQTPDTTKEAHMSLVVIATGETDVDLYEDTSLTDASGNRLTPVNRNRNSSNTSGLTVCHTPGGSGDGTLIANAIFGLDTGVGATAQLAGGEAGDRHEIILKRNAAYLLRVSSGTDGNRITVTLDWYEHTPKH